MEASNNLLRRRVQKKLNADMKLKLYFKNISTCGTHPNETNGLVLARRTDGKDAKFIGLNHCGNAWLCPNCAPRAAEKTSRWIAGALEIAQQYKQKAFMVTLTIGHYRAVPLKLLIDALDRTFKCIFTQSKCKTAGYVKMREFYNNVPMKHYIKSTEITWSYQFGWHPHIHLLYFVDSKDWNKILQWENTLNELWMFATKKYLTEEIEDADFLSDESKAEMISEVSKVYEKKLERTVGLHFSKDKNGNLIKQTSSSYITGWGANKELSDKEAKTCQMPGHFSIMQILQNAVFEDENKKDDTDELNFWWKLYFEIGYAVYKRKCRWAWSHTGLKKQAMLWLETLTEEEYKKKFMQGAKPVEWQTVCYIPSELYERLCQIDNYYQEIEMKILELAITDDYKAICEIFEKHRLPLPLRNSFFKVRGILEAA